MKFSVVILTKNEEKNILDCIESVSFADEVIVIDDNSDDRTAEIIKGSTFKNVRIYNHSLNDDFSSQRNLGLSKATSDWVLFLDADERIPNALRDEMLSVIGQQSNVMNGFYIKRVDLMWGRQLKHGEMGNMKLVRLAKKRAGVWKGKVHEMWDIRGEVGTLDNALMHYPHQSISEFLSEVDFYSTLRAQELHQNHVRTSLAQIIFYPKIKFFVNYFLRLGFLDGIPGFVVAVMMSIHSFLVRAKLWLLFLPK